MRLLEEVPKNSAKGWNIRTNNLLWKTGRLVCEIAILKILLMLIFA